MVAQIHPFPTLESPAPFEPVRPWLTWDHQQPPLKGTIYYAIALWVPNKGVHWKPRRPDEVPPMVAGRFTILFWESTSLEIVVRDVLDHNERQLRRGKRIRCWAVSVTMVCGHDKTARVVEGGADHA
jgi:hypothetical protein